MIGLSDKNSQARDVNPQPQAWEKSLFWAGVIILPLVTLILFSPSLSQPPLFDECYLLAWLSHCLKAGFWSADTSAYLLAPAADMRDGLTPLGALSLLTTAFLTGTSYSAMRFLQVALHLINAGLLFGIVASFSRRLLTTTPLAVALAFVSAFFFAAFPLTPEAVGWLYGWPIELGTTLALASSLILILTSEKKSALVAAAILGVIAPWLSLKVAMLGLLPAALIIGRHKKALFSEPALKATMVATLCIIGSSLGAAVVSLSAPPTVPETIKQLTVDKINLGQESQYSKGAGTNFGESFMDNGPGANLQAIALPINRKIDERYNRALRRLYFLLALPLISFIVALIMSAPLRVLTGLALLIVGGGALATNGAINGQTFYGARWLYPYMPATGLLWSLICLSPLFIKIVDDNGKRKFKILTIIQIIVAAAFVICFSYFFVDRTYRQCMSYKSNGKLWKVITATVVDSGRKQTSPFLIVRNLPPTLTVAPLISPFSPQLIDTQSGLPRTASLSAGFLKDALAAGKYSGLAVHYEKQYNGFLGTDIKTIDAPFGPVVDAGQIVGKLTPPLMYYQDTVKFDPKENLLHLVSPTKMGPALRMQCYGLSPVHGDFLCVEAKIDIKDGRDTQITQTNQTSPTNQTSQAPQLELHWLTNWLGDWEARDRKVTTTGPMSDGQFHRYYFPLRTLAWTTSGLPTNIMLGFPRGALVDLKSISLGAGVEPLPRLIASAVHKQDSNKNYFSHYCFNYPDQEDLGLCAVYGRDNALDLKYDVSAVPGAKGVVAEIVPLNEAFRNENSQYLAPSPDEKTTMHVSAKGTTGNIKIGSEQFGKHFDGAGLFSVRIFATGDDSENKTIGHASDSIKCLVDPRL